MLLLFEIYGIPKEGIPRAFSTYVTYQTVKGLRVPLSLLLGEGECAYVRVYAGEAERFRGVRIIAICGDCAFVQGILVPMENGKTAPALKAGECLYFENNTN